MSPGFWIDDLPMSMWVYEWHKASDDSLKLKTS